MSLFESITDMVKEKILRDSAAMSEKEFFEAEIAAWKRSEKRRDKYAWLEVPPLLKELNRTWSKSKNIVLRDSFFEDYFLNKGAAARYTEDVEIMSINGEANRLILEENQIIGGFAIAGE